jgi:hypothetical protein
LDPVARATRNSLPAHPEHRVRRPPPCSKTAGSLSRQSCPACRGSAAHLPVFRIAAGFALRAVACSVCRDRILCGPRRHRPRTAESHLSICAANDRSAVGYMSSRKGGPDANRRGPLSGGVELMKRSSAAVAQRSPLWGRFNKVGIGLSSGTNLPGPSQGEGRVWVN